MKNIICDQKQTAEPKIRHLLNTSFSPRTLSGFEISNLKSEILSLYLFLLLFPYFCHPSFCQCPLIFLASPIRLLVLSRQSKIQSTSPSPRTLSGFEISN